MGRGRKRQLVEAAARDVQARVQGSAGVVLALEILVPLITAVVQRCREKQVQPVPAGTNRKMARKMHQEMRRVSGDKFRLFAKSMLRRQEHPDLGQVLYDDMATFVSGQVGNGVPSVVQPALIQALLEVGESAPGTAYEEFFLEG